jgi:hypothetical protein
MPDWMAGSGYRFVLATLERCVSVTRQAECRLEPHVNFAPYPVSESVVTFTSNFR